MPKPTKVTLYSTSKCPHCRQAKQYLQQHKVPFMEFDIERNRRAMKDFQRLGGRGVPTIMVGDQRIDGFHAGQLKKALAARGLLGKG